MGPGVPSISLLNQVDEGTLVDTELSAESSYISERTASQIRQSVPLFIVTVTSFVYQHLGGYGGGDFKINAQERYNSFFT